MRVTDVPFAEPFVRKFVGMGELLARAAGSARASWTDLLGAPGIYVVARVNAGPITFMSTSGRVAHAQGAAVESLEAKWNRICRSTATDIIYIGKGDSIKIRLSQLARFGVGRARNHRGGEWMWQVSDIENAHVLMQSCPGGRQLGFENWLLEEFWNAHGEYPLANRDGPEGPDRWHP